MVTVYGSKTVTLKLLETSASNSFESVKKLIELLNEKPVHVIKVSERGTSSGNPFMGKRIKRFVPLVIRTAVKELKRVKVLKMVLRVAKASEWVLERDVVGTINIGLRYFSTNGSLAVLNSTDTHEVWVKQMNPHRGATLQTCLKLITAIHKHREQKNTTGYQL